MGTSDNWLASKFRVEMAQAKHAARFFRDLIKREMPKRRAELERLLEQVDGDRCASTDGCNHPHPSPLPKGEGAGKQRKRNTAAQRHAHRRDACATIPWDPAHPERWNKRLIEAELAKPVAAEMYLAIRRAIWDWPEFATLKPGARAILEVVVELARSEAFPWYVAVPAHEVRRLARLSEGSFARSARELMCFAVKRAARVVEVTDQFGVAKAAKDWKANETATAPAQFVVLYRRGIPFNAKRAAWWLNYDLLCRTGVVLPCFVFSPGNLQVTYQARNKAMGARPGVVDDDALAALKRALAQRGPPPEVGFRSALWRSRHESVRGGALAGDAQNRSVMQGGGPAKMLASVGRTAASA